MEELKIGGKAETGYMGGIKWTGVNATNGYLRYTEINKLVKSAFRKRYPPYNLFRLYRQFLILP